MIANHLTRSAFNYLGALYEEAVDAGMNLTDIQRHLSKHGINKPLLMIKNELNETYCFHRYAETHPAPPIMSYAQADAELQKPGRKIEKQGTVMLVATSKRSYNGCNDTPTLER